MVPPFPAEEAASVPQNDRFAAQFPPDFSMMALLYTVYTKNSIVSPEKASEKIPESEIIVVTQYEEIVKKAGEMKIPVFINPRPEDGISLSMQIGLMSVRDTDACLFTVSDQPWLEADTVVALIELFENEKKGMACIRWNGKTGNPCIFGQKYYEELMEISGDKGGKKIIKKHPEDVAYLQIRNAREVQDADEPDVFTAGNLR